MNANVRSRLQKMAEDAYDYISREREKRAKRKFVTRLDYIFVGFLVVLAVVIFSQPKGSLTTSTSQGSAVTPATSQDSGSTAAGMGGVTLPSGKGSAAKTTAQGPCAQPSPQCLPQPTTSQPSMSPPPPVDPVGVINNWNGKSLASTTYAASGNSGDWLANSNGTGALFQTDPGTTVNNSAMDSIWKAMAGIVGGFLTILLMLTGYKIMGGAIGIRYVNALEALPRVLLAGLGALLSIIFASFAIAIENGLCQTVVNTVGGLPHDLQYTDIVLPAGSWAGHVIAFAVAVLALFISSVLSLIPGIGWIVGSIAAGAIGIGVFLVDLQGIILTLLSIALAVQLIARFVMINIYIVISPLAVGCWALPSQFGQDVTRQWAKGFLSLVFVQFIQVICVSVGLLLFHKHTGDWTNFAGDVINFIGPIAILWLTIRIPRMFGTAGVGTIVEAGSTVAGAAAAIAIGAK